MMEPCCHSLLCVPEKSKAPCCHEGTAFFDALKAMVSRFLFLLHTLMVIWRVVEIMGSIQWSFCISLIGLLAETVVVLVLRKGHEWKWFQPSVLLYLLSVVPPIWLLELKCQDTLQPPSENTTISSCDDAQDYSFLSTSVSLSHRKWIVILEESLLVLIIITRWLMPKGDLSRDQLSSLLLAHLGTASDIVDFTSVLSEDMTYSPRFVHTVLILWTLSLLQFPFVVTATSGDFADNDQDDTRELRVEASNDQNTSPDASTKMSSKRCSLRQFGYSAKRHCHTFIETEAWGIIVSVLMQDGPFLLLRLVSMSEYQIFTYSNIFFASKNALVLLLQGYRLYCLFIERQEEKRRIERERQRAWRRIVFIDRISSVYTNINDA